MKRWRTGLILAALGLLLAGALALGLAWVREAWLAAPPPGLSTPVAPPRADAATLARGAYLVRIGNCGGCHSPRGGPALAGGVPLDTPFGTLYSSNLTPDPETGLGRWRAEDFRAALRLGRSRDGRLLYPGFPYTSYGAMTRADMDAIYLYLRSLAPVSRPRPAHQLSWPASSQHALALWRLAFFRPADVQEAARLAGESPGRYLVQAVGHCAECHGPRNRLGALRDATGLGGGWVGTQGWWAPSLNDPAEAGLQDWPLDRIAAWLRAGWSEQAVALGPMADVVADSLQHLSPEDAQAMARHLQSLPRVATPRPATEPAAAAQLALGRQVYARHCADCHGAQGEGRRQAGEPVYPALAGRRDVQQQRPDNLLQVLAKGGYAAATAAHPRPYGMPPLRQQLSEAELAAVASYVRQAWGHQASAVMEQQLLRLK